MSPLESIVNCATLLPAALLLAAAATLRVPDPTYLPTRFGALPDDWDRDNPEKLQQDTEQANRAIALLRAAHDRLFFLSVGFWRPHSERIVPKLLPTVNAPEIEPARPWDGSELNADIFKQIAQPVAAPKKP